MINSHYSSKLLLAFQALLIHGRKRAYEGAPSKVAYDIFDGAEYLVGLMVEHGDTTALFTDYLRDMAISQGCQLAVSILDSDNP